LFRALLQLTFVLFGTKTASSTSAVYDTYIAALDAQGAWQWAAPAFYSGFYSQGSAAIASAGQLVFAAGRMQGSRAIGSLELSSSGAGDVWVSTSFSLVW
jgi:hypothetical protein